MFQAAKNSVPQAPASIVVGNLARQVRNAAEFGDKAVAETLLSERQVVELSKLDSETGAEYNCEL